MTKAMYDLACTYRRVFTETVDGKAVYDDLVKGYCTHSNFHLEGTAMAFLEGHRDVVLRINTLIEMANTPIDKLSIQEEGDEDDAGRHSEYFNDPIERAREQGGGGHYL